jgi:hypothetical protein
MIISIGGIYMMHLGDPFSRQSWDKPVKKNRVTEYTDDQEEVLDELGQFRFTTLQEQAEIEISRDLLESGLLQPEDLV